MWLAEYLPILRSVLMLVGAIAIFLIVYFQIRVLSVVEGRLSAVEQILTRKSNESLSELE
jgi:hypothetical protein